MGIIKIEGSVELAPLLGLADGIVDIVETGTTLKENGLEVVERVADVSARLIVNAASLKLRKEEIETLAGQPGSGHRRKKGTGEQMIKTVRGRLADLPVLCGGPEKPGGRDLPGD